MAHLKMTRDAIARNLTVLEACQTSNRLCRELIAHIHHLYDLWADGDDFRLKIQRRFYCQLRWLGFVGGGWLLFLWWMYRAFK